MHNDVLIDKLNNVCDNIERKFAWSMKLPCPCPLRYSSHRKTEVKCNAPTQTRTRIRNIACQTIGCARNIAIQYSCVGMPVGQPKNDKSQTCRITAPYPFLSSMPPAPASCPLAFPSAAPPPPATTCPLAYPLPAPPLPVAPCAPLPCGFDVPVMDTNKEISTRITCSAKSLCDTGCQTMRNERNSQSIQCSLMKPKESIVDFDEESIIYESDDEKLLGRTAVLQCEATPSESLRTIQSIPFSAVFPPSSLTNRSKPENNCCDRLKLDSIDLDNSTCQSTPSGIYKDCRFHKFIQIQETNKAPTLCSASLINLNSILEHKTGNYVASKIKKQKSASAKKACDCTESGKPVTFNNLEQITRNADYLAVKAAIDISKYNNECSEDCNNNKTFKDNNAERKPDCCINKYHDIDDHYRRKLSTGGNRKTNSFLFPDLTAKRVSIQSEESKLDSESESESDDEMGSESSIIEEILRKTLSRPSTTSTDSVLRDSSSTKDRKRRKKEQERSRERAHSYKKYDINNFEIYNMSQKERSIFKQKENQQNIENTRRRYFTKNLRQLMNKTSNSVLHSKKSCLRSIGNQDFGKKVSFSISKTSATKYDMPRKPRITPTSPPIPRVSQILHAGESKAVKCLLQNSSSSTEYIQGLFDFLRKTKKHTEDTSVSEVAPSTSGHSDESKCAEVKKPDERNILSDTQENNAKAIDWTEVAKLLQR